MCTRQKSFENNPTGLPEFALAQWLFDYSGSRVFFE